MKFTLFTDLPMSFTWDQYSNKYNSSLIRKKCTSPNLFCRLKRAESIESNRVISRQYKINFTIIQLQCGMIIKNSNFIISGKQDYVCVKEEQIEKHVLYGETQQVRHFQVIKRWRSDKLPLIDNRFGCFERKIKINWLWSLKWIKKKESFSNFLKPLLSPFLAPIIRIVI